MIYLCGVNLSMRELTFELDYVDRVGPLIDIFTDCSELTSASIASCVDRDCCWVVERFVGPASVLDQIDWASAPPLKETTTGSPKPQRTRGVIPPRCCV